MAFAAQRSSEPTSTEQPGTRVDVPPSANEVSVQSTLPSMPAGGLVVLRFQPSPAQEPEVKTVFVERAAPAPAPSRAASSAPAPRSSGS
jgi:hypothetical protein